jgi:hypothetical protein
MLSIMVEGNRRRGPDLRSVPARGAVEVIDRDPQAVSFAYVVAAAPAAGAAPSQSMPPRRIPAMGFGLLIGQTPAIALQPAAIVGTTNDFKL